MPLAAHENQAISFSPLNQATWLLLVPPPALMLKLKKKGGVLKNAQSSLTSANLPSEAIFSKMYPNLGPAVIPPSGTALS